MKKFFVFIVGLFIVGTVFAVGENIPTSKNFVDTAVAQKQNKIPANTGAAQVLTNTGNAGEIGTKNIYDSSASYVEQTHALVTAGAFNTAVQNAIESEFVCVEYDTNNECLLLEIRGAPQQSILPAGYTALEYIESDGHQCIDTGVTLSSDDVVYEWNAKDNNPVFDSRGLFGSEYWIDASTDYFITSGVLVGGKPLRITYIGETHSLDMGYTSTDDLFHSWRFVINSDYTQYLVKDGDKLQTYNWTGPLNKMTPIALFCVYTRGVEYSQASSITLKYFRIIDNGVLVFNGIPARRDSDSVTGIYDTVSDRFLTDMSGVGFIAGPVAQVYMPSGN